MKTKKVNDKKDECELFLLKSRWDGMGWDGGGGHTGKSLCS